MITVISNFKMISMIVDGFIFNGVIERYPILISQRHVYTSDNFNIAVVYVPYKSILVTHGKNAGF